jgi:hypothetical protein
MCGACGSDRGADDWARPFLSSLPARHAVATSISRLAGPRGPKVHPRAGGWLVRSPTGVSTDCSGLGELVAVVDRWLGAPTHRRGAALGPAFDPDRPPSGRLAVPGADARRGVQLRIDPTAAPQPLCAELDTAVVPSAEAALDVLAELSRPPWSLRRYLTTITGSSRPWADEPAVVSSSVPERGADLVLWLEQVRRGGELDNTAVQLRCPLDEATMLDVQVRAGHVVRARAHPA